MTSLNEARNSEISFLKELAHALGISAMELGLAYPQHLFGERLINAQQRLGESAINAVINQRLAGRLALKAYHRFAHPSLKHGSHMSPTQLSPRFIQASGRKASPVLKPQQAFWRDADGRLYKDGQPAICSSDSYEYPLLRSLLNRKHLPGFEGFVFSSRRDSTNTMYDFTGRTFLTAIQEGGITGWQYMIDLKDKSEYLEKYKNPITQAAWEYRLFKDEYPIAWVASTASDLPPELLIVDGESHHAHEFIRTLPQTSLMEQIHRFDETLDVQPLGGLFPLSLHPNFQQ